jgi:hypothetical protein
MMPTNQVSTQTVMAKGVQTKRPASKYFLIGMWCFVVLKNQWQAQPEAQPPDATEAAGAAGLLEAVSVLLLAVWVGEALSEDVAVATEPAAAVGAEAPPEPPLKSVAYQPEPFS